MQAGVLSETRVEDGEFNVYIELVVAAVLSSREVQSASLTHESWKDVSGLRNMRFGHWVQEEGDTPAI